MRLHLDSVLSKAADTSQASALPSGGNASGRSGSSAGSRDSVGISGLSAALSAASADRASRIQQLSLAVANGSYNVSSSAIGKAIVSHAIS